MSRTTLELEPSWPWLWLVAAICVVGAPGIAAAEAPWSPSRWPGTRTGPSTVSLTEQGVLLRLVSEGGADPALTVVDPRTMEIEWPGRQDTVIALEPPSAPIESWALAHDERYRLRIVLRRPLATTLRRMPEGWLLEFGARTRAPVRGIVHSTDDVWSLTDASDLDVDLHRAMREARAGRWGLALARVAPLADSDRSLAARASALYVEGTLLLAADLPLLAIDPLASAARISPEEAIARRSIRAIREIADAVPETLVLVRAELLNTWRQGSAEGRWLAFEAGRALLDVMEPGVAAERLLEAAGDPWLAPRARYLVHVAARLAGDADAARAHLQWILAHRSEADSLHQAARSGLARMAFDEGRLGDAARLYEALLRQVPEHRTARVEAESLALRLGQPPNWEALVPFRLESHGVAHALAVGTRYHQMCHPRRAAAVAGGIIAMMRRDPLADRLDDERRRLDSEVWSVVRRRLMARLERYHTLRASHRNRTMLAFYRRAALRLRISADARTGDETIAGLALAAEPQVPEPPYQGWRGDRWIDDAAAALRDRCQPLGSEPPMARQKAPSSVALTVDEATAEGVIRTDP